MKPKLNKRFLSKTRPERIPRTDFNTQELSERFFSLARRRDIFELRSVRPVREQSKNPDNAASGKKIRLISGDVLGEPKHITGIAVLIVVPANQLDESAVQRNTCF